MDGATNDCVEGDSIDHHPTLPQALTNSDPDRIQRTPMNNTTVENKRSSKVTACTFVGAGVNCAIVQWKATRY